MTCENDRERRLDDFLRHNEPLAPLPPEGECARIRFFAERRSKRSAIGWSAAAAAALVLALLGIYRADSDRRELLVAEISGEESLSAMFDSVWQETDEVGAEYIDLARAVAR
jgi:hypothetical protein